MTEKAPDPSTKLPEEPVSLPDAESKEALGNAEISGNVRGNVSEKEIEEAKRKVESQPVTEEAGSPSAEPVQDSLSSGTLPPSTGGSGDSSQPATAPAIETATAIGPDAATRKAHTDGPVTVNAAVQDPVAAQAGQRSGRNDQAANPPPAQAPGIPAVVETPQTPPQQQRVPTGAEAKSPDPQDPQQQPSSNQRGTREEKTPPQPSRGPQQTGEQVIDRDQNVFSLDKERVNPINAKRDEPPTQPLRDGGKTSEPQRTNQSESTPAARAGESDRTTTERSRSLESSSQQRNDEPKRADEPRPREEVRQTRRDEGKPEQREESRQNTQQELRNEARPETKQEPRQESRQNTQQELRNEARPETKQEPRHEPRENTQQEPRRTEVSSSSKPPQEAPARGDTPQEVRREPIKDAPQRDAQTEARRESSKESQRVVTSESRVQQLVTKLDEQHAAQARSVQPERLREIRSERIDSAASRLERDIRSKVAIPPTASDPDRTVERVLDTIAKRLQGISAASSSGADEKLRLVQGSLPAREGAVSDSVKQAVSAPAAKAPGMTDGAKTKSADLAAAPERANKALEAIQKIVASAATLSIKDLQQIAKILDVAKPEIPVKIARSIEEMNAAPVTKEQALRAIVGMLVDAQRLSSGLVAEVKRETDMKIAQVQSNVDEVLKLRIQQFVALSAYQDGVSPGRLQELMHEAVHELATRYGLTEEQRALLGRIMVALASGDFERPEQRDQKKPDTVTPEDKLKADIQRLKELAKMREASPEEIMKARADELMRLEEQLKERDEIRQIRAENKLREMALEELDPDVKYLIDEDLEVIKVFIIRGRVLDERSGDPVPDVTIVGGLLGPRQTDLAGCFEYVNVPEDTAYMIGADKEGLLFRPVFYADTLTRSVTLEFRALRLSKNHSS